MSVFKQPFVIFFIILLLVYIVDLLPNVIVYFDDATIENGALKIIEKSHTYGILPGRTDENFEYPGFFTDKKCFNVNNAVTITAKAGSVCFFNPHTVHGSSRNLTNQSRRAIILTYQPVNFPMLKNGRVRNCIRKPLSDNLQRSALHHRTTEINWSKDVSKL